MFHFIIFALLFTSQTTASPPVSSSISFSKSSRVAIVGAGPSGVLTAWHLSRKGYTDITIFENFFRAGGYVSSFPYKNVSHDMSTYAVNSIYWRFVAAAESLGIQFCNISGEFAVSRPNGRAEKIVSGGEFFASVSSPTLEDPTAYPAELEKQIRKYIQLWVKLFRIPFVNDELLAEQLFPDKPTDPKVLETLAKPTTQFLQEQGLDLLIPIFRNLDYNAYGPLEETSALYAMAWLQPSVLIPTGRPTAIPCGKYDSFQRVIDRFVEAIAGNVKIVFGTHVTQVTRGRDSASIVTQSGAVNQFDRVIVTAPLNRPGTRQSTLVIPRLSKELPALRTFEELEIYSALLAGRRNTVFGKDHIFISNPLQTLFPNETDVAYAILHNEVADKDGPFHSDSDTFGRVSGFYFYRQRRMGQTVKLSEKKKETMLIEQMRYYDDTTWSFINTRNFKNYFQRYVLVLNILLISLSPKKYRW